MNLNKALAGGALALGVLAGCGPAQKELHIYTWCDYIAPGVIEKFEKQFNCRVLVDTFDSNESMYAKLLAGSTGYDIAMPSSYQIPVMAKNGMIMPLDHAKLPNVRKNFDKSFEKSILDKSFKYNVPYIVTYTGFAYRKDKVGSAPVDSWHVYETAALKGRMSLLSDMRETIGGGLMALGYSLNSEKQDEIDQAVELVLKWKQNIAKFDNEQYKTGVASGEWFVGHGYSSDTTQVLMEDKNVGFALPKEGFSICFDEMVVMNDSKEKDLAHAFINFVYTPEIAKENIEEVLGPMPVAAALAALDPKLRKAVVFDAATLARGQVMRDFDDKPAVRDMYVKAWDRIKAGK